MNAEPKRRWWRKKRWWAAVPALLAAYLVSSGPAAYGIGRGWILPTTYRAAYGPAEPGINLCGCTEFYEVYATSCWLRGVDHRKSLEAAAK
jgi:hypothetical protein